MKTAFVINGLNIHATAADESFRQLREAIAAKGYKVVAVDIGWRQTVPTRFAEQFMHLYNQHKSDHNTFIGNSFGAVVALLAAPELKPDRLILCSLSPFFQEDTTKSWPKPVFMKRLGIRRLRDISQYSSEELADQVSVHNIKTTIMYGELEHQSNPALVARAKAMAKLIKNAKLVEAPQAPHSFKDSAYVKAIAAEL